MGVALVGTPQAIDITAATGVSYTPEAGADRIAGFFGANSAGGSRTITACTLGGVAATSDYFSLFNSSSVGGWYGFLKEASMASGNMAVTWSGTTTQAGIGRMMTFTGVDQTSPIRDQTKYQTTTTAIDPWPLTGKQAEPGDMAVLICAGHTAGPSWSLPSGYTQQVQATYNAAGDRYAIFTKPITVSAVETPVVDLSATNTGIAWLIILKGKAAAPTVPPDITSTTLNAMQVGSVFSQQLTATGDLPITWTVASGAVPAGLTLASDGTLSGTPSAGGAYSFTAQATNSAGNDTQAYSGTVSYPSIQVTGLPKPANSYSVCDGLSYPIANGDTIEYQTKTNLNADVTMRADGTFVISSSSGTHTFQCRCKSVALGNIWSNYYTVTASPS